MRIPRRLPLLLATAFMSAALASGGAIVPGFDATSDGRSDDGTYTAPSGCDNPFPGGTCSGTAVPIGFDINFFGNIHNELFINTNGNVTFDGPLSTFDPFELNDSLREIIAPFFADVDTRNPASGVITFGNGIFDGRNAFGVNWINVGYFEEQATNTNSFQLLLVDRSNTGAGNFDIIFNFDRVLWEAGDGSFGIDGLGGYSARSGFSDGTGDPSKTVELTGSGIPGSFIDGGTDALVEHSLNSDVLGRYIFSSRVVAPVPEPGTMALMAGGVALICVSRIHANLRVLRSTKRNRT